jgi:hypothetical protein
MTLSTVTRAPMLNVRAPRVNALLRYAVVSGCALSVGVHIGIIPAHFDEGALLEVTAFAATSAVLAVLALSVHDAGHDSWAPLAAAASLGAVAGAYLLSRTVGLPLLVPEAESFDVTGLTTVTAELASAAAGIALFLCNRKEQP